MEYDRATGSATHKRVKELLQRRAELATTEPIMTEILAGARDDQREASLRRFLNRFSLLPFESPTDFDGAARLYRLCRATGITPRGLIEGRAAPR